MYAKMYSTGRYDYLFDVDFTYSPSARTNPDVQQLDGYSIIISSS